MKSISLAAAVSLLVFGVTYLTCHSAEENERQRADRVEAQLHQLESEYAKLADEVIKQRRWEVESRALLSQAGDALYECSDALDHLPRRPR